MLDRGQQGYLMDVDTENDSVIKAYCDWIGPFVEEYGIDRLRIDAAWHIRADFWRLFAEATGVFCIGEVFGNDPAQRRPSGKDSRLYSELPVDIMCSRMTGLVIEVVWVLC